MMKTITVRSINNYQNEVTYDGNSNFFADEPVAVGGDGTGPDPYTLLMASLGACTSMTATMYARRKEWPLSHTTVTLSSERVHADDCADCRSDPNAFIHRISRKIEFEGDLTDEQLVRLGEIAARCPVGKMLESEIKIVDEF